MVPDISEIPNITYGLFQKRPDIVNFVSFAKLGVANA